MGEKHELHINVNVVVGYLLPESTVKKTSIGSLEGKISNRYGISWCLVEEITISLSIRFKDISIQETLPRPKPKKDVDRIFGRRSSIIIDLRLRSNSTQKAKLKQP